MCPSGVQGLETGAEASKAPHNGDQGRQTSHHARPASDWPGSGGVLHHQTATVVQREEGTLAETGLLTRRQHALAWLQVPVLSHMQAGVHTRTSAHIVSLSLRACTLTRCRGFHNGSPEKVDARFVCERPGAPMYSERSRGADVPVDLNGFFRIYMLWCHKIPRLLRPDGNGREGKGPMPLANLFENRAIAGVTGEKEIGVGTSNAPASPECLVVVGD